MNHCTESVPYTYIFTPVAKILEKLLISDGQYVNAHNGQLVKSKYFAVLIIGYDGYVCPLPEERLGLYWSYRLNPIELFNGKLVMSHGAVHALNDDGLTIFDAIDNYNKRCTTARIHNVFTFMR